MCGIAGTVRSDGEPVERELLERMCEAIEHRGPDARGIHARRRSGPRHPASARDRRRRRRPADLQRGRLDRGRPQRRDLQLPRAATASSSATAIASPATATPRRSSISTRSAASTAYVSSMGCSPSPSGTSAGGDCCWPATGSARSRCSTRCAKAPSRSPPSCRPSFTTATIPRDADPVAIDAYLAYGYVPAPLSAFAAVRKLPPASTLVYEGGGATIESYWRLDYARKHEVSDPRDLHEPLRDLLRAAVRRRLVSDVPLGAFLSGGIDSSAVVAAMARETSEPVRTFSIGFDVSSARRARARPSCRGAVRNRAPRAAGQARRGLPGAADRPSPRRAVRRLLLAAELPSGRAGAAPCHGRAQRRRRRRVLCRLHPVCGERPRWATRTRAGPAAQRRGAVGEVGSGFGSGRRSSRQGAPARRFARPGRPLSLCELHVAVRRRGSHRLVHGRVRGGGRRSGGCRRGDRGSVARLLRARPARRPARGRCPHLPAGRPAGEDRHGDDGATRWRPARPSSIQS